MTTRPTVQSKQWSRQCSFTGTFKPNAPLSAFKGLDPNGTWNFQAQDFFSVTRQHPGVLADHHTDGLHHERLHRRDLSGKHQCAATDDWSSRELSGRAPTGACGVLNYSTASGSTFPVGTTIVNVTGGQHDVFFQLLR